MEELKPHVHMTGLMIQGEKERELRAKLEGNRKVLEKAVVLLSFL